MGENGKSTPKTNDDLWNLITSMKSEIRQEIQGALQRIDDIEEKLNNRMTTVETQQTELQTTACTKTEMQKMATGLQADLKEQKEQILRKDNIIIFGIPENENGDQLYSQLINIIADHLHAFPYKERVGDPEKASNRPIRVFLPPGTKRTLLSKCKRLKNKPKFEKVSVCSDLTKLQRATRSPVKTRSKKTSSTTPAQPNPTSKTGNDDAIPENPRKKARESSPEINTTQLPISTTTINAPVTPVTMDTSS